MILLRAKDGHVFIHHPIRRSRTCTHKLILPKITTETYHSPKSKEVGISTSSAKTSGSNTPMDGKVLGGSEKSSDSDGTVEATSLGASYRILCVRRLMAQSN
jgi:hypothetical protein